MWNVGYDSREYPSGYGNVNEFDTYQQDNRYSNFYQQQQPTYQLPYQPPGFSESYFTPYQQPTDQNPYQPPNYQEQYFPPSQEHYPPQPQDRSNNDMAELKALVQEYLESQQRMSTMLDDRIAETAAYNSMWQSFNATMPGSGTLDISLDMRQNDQVEILGEYTDDAEIDVEIFEEIEMEDKTIVIPLPFSLQKYFDMTAKEELMQSSQVDVLSEDLDVDIVDEDADDEEGTVPPIELILEESRVFLDIVDDTVGDTMLAIWGKKNYELTGEGEYGEHPSNIMGEIEIDLAATGHVFEHSHGGLQDQFYRAHGSSSGRSRNRLDYDDPGDA